MKNKNIYLKTIKDDYSWILEANGNKFLISSSRTYKKNFMNQYIDKKIEEQSDVFFFKKNLSTKEKQLIISILNKIASEKELNLVIDDFLKNTIDKGNRLIKERKDLGTALKNKQFSNKNILNKWNEFKEFVNNKMIRPLTQKQMINAFLHY